MSEAQKDLEIKFRLHDGTDIGPNKYPSSISVASLKQSVFDEWPKGEANGPRTANDLKLINAGMILENHKTLQEYQSPITDLLGGVTTMHIVVRPPLEKGREKKVHKKSKEPTCGCVII